MYNSYNENSGKADNKDVEDFNNTDTRWYAKAVPLIDHIV